MKNKKPMDHHMYMGKAQIRFTVITLTFLLMGLLSSYSFSHGLVKIGVLTQRGREVAFQRWNKTAEYLSHNIEGYSFTILPLNFEEIAVAVKNNEIDFVLTNTGMFVNFEASYGVVPLATLKEVFKGKEYTRFGGTVFTLKEREDIETFEDLKGKSFGAVNVHSLGGWQMAFYEFKKKKLDLLREFSSLSFLETHDAVVYGVLNGKIDVGTVRSETLERMEAEGKITIDDFKILNYEDSRHHDLKAFPLLHSTSLLPEWPFAKLGRTSSDLSEKVALALFSMKPDDPPALSANISGWTVPLDYRPVHRLMESLKIGPYKHTRELKTSEFIKKHAVIFSLVVLMFFLLTSFLLNTLILNKRVKRELKAKESAERKLLLFRRVLDQSEDSIFVIEPETGLLIEVNEKVPKSLAFSPEELFNLHVWEIETTIPGKSSWDTHVSEMKGRGSLLMEGIHRRKDGTEFPVEVSIKYIEEMDKNFVLAVARDVSARKKLEAELLESKVRFEAAFKSASIGMVITKIDGTWIEVNEPMCKITGYKKKELEGMNYRDITHPDDLKADAALAHSLLDGERKNMQMNKRYIHKSGEPVWISLDVSLARDSEERPLYFVAQITDINEKKRALAALKESENRYKQLFSKSLGVFLLIDPASFEIKDANEAACLFYGYSPEKIKTMKISDLNTCSPEKIKEEMIKAIEEKRTSSIFKHRLASGEVRDVEVFSGPVEIKSKTLLFSIIHDITDRTQLENKLVVSEQRFRLLTESSPAGVFLTDAKGECLYVNPKWVEFAGMTIESARGQGWIKALHPDDKKAVFDEWYRSASFKEEFKMQYRFRTREGRTTWLDGHAAPLLDEKGIVSGYIGTVIDIGAIKESEERLKAAKEKAVEATKLKDKFVALVTHDLRAPFVSINGLLKIVLKKGELLTSEHRDILTMVMESSENMSSMVEELLNVSRLQTGLTDLRKAFLNGYETVEATISKLAGMAEAKEIIIENKVPEEYRLFADRSLFSTVIQNILSNSIKFTERRGKITLFVTEENKGRISVRDTGQGITERMIPGLFDYNRKTSSRGTAGEKGTGMGLPLAMDIMKAHDGDILLESEVGKGSTFHLQLKHRKPVLLIAEDDAPVRYVMLMMLSEPDTEIIEVTNGMEALKVIRKREVDLIVSDLKMPVMDGLSLLKEIKQDPEKKNIPFIVITSYSDSDTQNDLFRFGASDFVAKPIEENDLLPRIKRYLW